MKYSPISFSLFISLLLLLGVSCKKTNYLKVKSKDELYSKLEREISKKGLSSIGFAVTKNGELLLADAIGQADPNSGIACTPTTQYLISSVSKIVPLIALMQLYEQQKFQLDDDISAYLPYSIRNPSYPNDKITFRMLLNQTSSITDLHQNNFDLYTYGSDCTTALSTYMQSVFGSGGTYYSNNNFNSFTPGKFEEHTRLGMSLAAYLVERISQQSFEQYCQSAIFTPLNMTHTQWHLAGLVPSFLAVPQVPTISTGSQYTRIDFPANGLRSSAEDLSKLLRVFVMKGVCNGVQVLSASSVETLLTTNTSGSDQAFVLYYTEINSKRYLGISGGDKGVTTEFYFDPATAIGVLALNNDDDTDMKNTVTLLFNYGALQ